MDVHLCPLHHIPLIGGMICLVCNDRDSYMVRGNVRAFDQGYQDGFEGRSSRVSAWSGHANKGDYEHGYDTGRKQAPNGTLRSIRAARRIACKSETP